MQHARKMVLVPHDVARQLHTSHHNTMTPTYEGLDGLDEQMQSIIRRRDIPIDERVKLYQQALLGYVNMHQKLKQPMAVKVETMDISPEERNASAQSSNVGRAQTDRAPSWVHRVAESVPKTLKKKAEQLVQLVEHAPSNVLRFNEAGELIVGDRRMEGTHIVDLINDVLRKRKSFHPRGWEIFARALATLHPPQELIGNEDRWRYMQKSGRKTMVEEGSTLKTDNESADYDEQGGMYARAVHLPPSRKIKRTSSKKPVQAWLPY